MKWLWRGTYFSAGRSEYEFARRKLETERFPVKEKFKNPPKTDKDKNPKFKKKFDSQPQKKDIGFYELSPEEQNEELVKKLKDLSKKIYKTSHKSTTEEREATMCQRENPFYIDTVRAFRDRRYEYKRKLKGAQINLEKLQNEGASQAQLQEAQKLVVLYDSLQLAHKCILNSFYGYVMRKGARWFSMEMAGAGVLSSSNCWFYQWLTPVLKLLPKQESSLRRLADLSNWILMVFGACYLLHFHRITSSFLQMERGTSFWAWALTAASFTFSYPCVILNKNVAVRFTNDQYQDWDPQTNTWKTHRYAQVSMIIGTNSS